MVCTMRSQQKRNLKSHATVLLFQNVDYEASWAGTPPLLGPTCIVPGNVYLHKLSHPSNYDDRRELIAISIKFVEDRTKYHAYPFTYRSLNNLPHTLLCQWIRRGVSGNEAYWFWGTPWIFFFPSSSFLLSSPSSHSSHFSCSSHFQLLPLLLLPPLLPL